MAMEQKKQTMSQVNEKIKSQEETVVYEKPKATLVSIKMDEKSTGEASTGCPVFPKNKEV